MKDDSILGLARKEIEDHCCAPAQSAYEHAVQIGRILLRLHGQLSPDEVIPWCLANTMLTESTARLYMSLAQDKITSPFALMLDVLGQAYRLLISAEEQKQIDKIDEGRRAYLRKRRKIASEWLTEIIRADSGKFASPAKFMENWFKITDPNEDKEQEILFIIIEDYLANLANPNRRLQAIHSLITRLRRRGTDYQVDIATEK